NQNVRRWIAYAAALVLTLGAVNYQIVANLPTFVFAFSTEMADLTRKDKRGGIPHIRQVRRTLKKEIPNLVAILYVGTLAYPIRRRRSDPLLWMCLLYPAVFTVVLAYSPRLFTRHFLPVLVTVNVAAGIGLVAMLRDGLPRIPWLSRRLAVRAVL